VTVETGRQRHSRVGRDGTAARYRPGDTVPCSDGARWIQRANAVKAASRPRSTPRCWFIEVDDDFPPSAGPLAPAPAERRLPCRRTLIHRRAGQQGPRTVPPSSGATRSPARVGRDAAAASLAESTGWSPRSQTPRDLVRRRAGPKNHGGGQCPAQGRGTCYEVAPPIRQDDDSKTCPRPRPGPASTYTLPPGIGAKPAFVTDAGSPARDPVRQDRQYCRWRSDSPQAWCSHGTLERAVISACAPFAPRRLRPTP